MNVRTGIESWIHLDPYPQPPLQPTRYPVMLMHGFGMIAAIRWPGHLHDVALDLRSRGVAAYAPNVAPYNTVAERAKMWQERLHHILKETGAEKVNLVAHSMGGLDARYLVQNLEMHRNVASVTTVATPHRGTSIARFIMDQPAQVQRWAAELINRIGEAAMHDTHPDVSEAVAQLTPEYVKKTFNPSCPDHPDVLYRSYAGQAGKGTDVPINPFLRPFNSIIFEREGVNDGYIAVESARWGTFCGTINADHTLQIGIKLSQSSFNHLVFFREVITQLRGHEL